MKVGDYVRIKNTAGYCYIGKLLNINEFREPNMKYCVDIQADDLVFVSKEMITKFGEILDVIEEGDFVNKNKVGCFRKENCDYDIGFSYNDDWGEWYGIDADEVKSVITHEQMEAMEYKVGEII